MSTTCATADAYMAQYGERIRYVTALGDLVNLYGKLCNVPGLGGIMHAQQREGARAVQSGIDIWCKYTRTTLPGLLWLPENKYASQEKELLDTVRRAVKRFVVFWDGKRQCDELYRKPVGKHLEDYDKGQELFREYEMLTTEYMPELQGKIVIRV